jgi:hypothetical protein
VQTFMLLESSPMSWLLEKGHITVEIAKPSENKCWVVKPKFLLAICQRYLKKELTLSTR